MYAGLTPWKYFKSQFMDSLSGESMHEEQG